MTYNFKYKRRWFYRTIAVDGHRYEAQMDKMVLYFQDGSIQEIPRWKDCHLKLGFDWVVRVKKDMEQKAGVAIPLAK